MSAVAEILDRIESTNERVLQLERAALHPGAPASLRVSIRAMEKLKASLERDFERLAMDEETEVCRYRLLPKQGERPSVTAIARAWTNYQSFFSSVYDSLKNGRDKKRTRKKSIEQTQLAFAYTFSGSIGVALTLPTRKIEYYMTRDLEQTNETILEMVKAQTAEQLAQFVDRLGVPPVAKLGAWVDAHVSFGAGAGVDWQISNGSAPPLLVQIQEFTKLKEAMNKITEPTEVEELVTGLLLMADMDRRTFRMKLDSGERIDGRFSDAINQDQKAELPQRYVASVRTTRTIKPAIEKVVEARFLVRLVRQLPI
jgi:hypothetical protein